MGGDLLLALLALFALAFAEAEEPEFREFRPVLIADVKGFVGGAFVFVMAFTEFCTPS
jgi:hypothetical protein